MSDRIAVTVHTNAGTFRKLFLITTVGGSTDEIQTIVNRIVNHYFPIDKFSVLSSSWSYSK